jgi:hypothetical protein
MGCCCREDMCALLVNKPHHLKHSLLSFCLGNNFLGFHIGSNAEVMGLGGNMSEFGKF